MANYRDRRVAQEILKEVNDILHKKYSDLNNTRKELIMQRQKLLQLSNSQRELEIEKKMIKS